ncbi:MAG: RHS Repeat family [Microgenomates group bacterium GW2011_GWC2_46_7]|nr:MAG: RHS Repeat family [Microgenomates group bacterium GW2011_GWC2_46_7]
MLFSPRSNYALAWSSSITSSTAQNYLNSHPGCRLESGWEFQYGLDTQVSKYGSGDQLGAASTPWQTLGTTNGSGVATTTISNLQGKSGIWVREVLQPNYVPFSYPPAGPTENNYSAELYCHQDGDHYDNFDQIDNPLFGNTYYCVAFNALNTGDLEVTKYNDLNGNGQQDPGELGLSDWQINVSGEESQNTDVLGSTTFNDLVVGSYELSETLQAGWTQTEISCGTIDQPEGQIEDDEYYAQVHPGQTTYCKIGNAPLTDIHGYKWNDVNGDGERGEEDLLGDWTIFLDENENGQLDQEERSATTEDNDESQDFGWYIFHDLFPGDYSICEVQQDGWTQTYPSACHHITLPNDQKRTLNGVEGPQYDFGNQADPMLTLEKSNDALGAQGPGSDVLYTLKVELSGSNVNEVIVEDAPPSGFTYHLGSWTANSSLRGDLKALLITTEPTYASPGVWQLGDMVPGEVVTLTYLADVSTSQDSGIYKDLAWAQGKNSYSDAIVRATGQNSTYVDGIFVGTDVEIDQSQRQTGSVAIEKTGEVLGASTSLPATGANSLWLFLALGSLLSGLALIFGGKFMKFFTVMLITSFSLLAPLVPSAQAATNADPSLSVRMETPKTPIRISDWTLAFTVLDIDQRALTVQCLVKKPTGSFVQFDTDKIFPATMDKSSGGNGTCQVNGSVMNTQGTYEFYVTASAGAGLDVTDTQSVVYDTEGPDRPVSYGKDRPWACRYTIKFKTADDGGKTTSVELYGSKSTTFNTDNSTRIGGVSIGSNQEGSLNHDLVGDDCNQNWYYVIHAFDSVGNQSAHIGDEVVNISTVAPSPTTGALVVTTATGSILGKDTVSGSDSGEVMGETASPTPSVEGQGLISGATDAVKAVTAGNRKWWLLAIVLAILVGYAYFKKAKTQ